LGMERPLTLEVNRLAMQFLFYFCPHI